MRFRPLARAVLVTGKGGVGKTSVAAGLAVSATRSGQKAVFIEFGDGQCGERALGAYRHLVEHVVIDPDHAVSRAAGPLFHSAMLSRLVLGNFAMRRLLRAAPGIRELAMLETVRQIVEQYPDCRVVVDMPATGHGLAWLRVPSQVAAITTPGPFRRLVDKVAEDLIAPGKCSIVVVTLPERLVLKETVELCHSMLEEVGLETDRLVINRMPEVISDDALRDAKRLAETGPESLRAPAHALAQTLEVRSAAREQGQHAIAEVLGDDRLRPVILPRSPVDPSASEVADWFEEEGAA
ncbi:MAG: hypothetical protein AUK47_05715 [Deltaproteobacteria bacterium CG2_30_63_29]|nr:MAG: hypothetical protein AUK47_05715 [Deltaproteobacteria bacterium CG2_30_63_29]PJB42166.1 MAG: hypothetical protein CO108_12100 [Deltaproteobacteria bacterium CG_4_9_14_3_um_filter_63_12]